MTMTWKKWNNIQNCSSIPAALWGFYMKGFIFLHKGENNAQQRGKNNAIIYHLITCYVPDPDCLFSAEGLFVLK